MIIATAVKHLIAAGISGDKLIAAIADMEATISQNSPIEKRKQKDRERKAIKRLSTDSAENAEMSDKENAPLNPPLDGFPHLSLIPPLYPPQKKNRERERISLNELSIEHVSGWLEEKQASGVYVGYDPGFVLEQLRDYCRSSGKTYKDYAAAYRNAFAWEKSKPQTQRKNYATNNREQKDRAFVESGDRILALTEAFIRDKNS